MLNKLGELVKHVEGAKNLYVEPVTGMPQVLLIIIEQRLLNII
jgi:hypothetical protein